MEAHIGLPIWKIARQIHKTAHLTQTDNEDLDQPMQMLRLNWAFIGCKCQVEFYDFNVIQRLQKLFLSLYLL